ncbi:MAG: hypothetical protein AAGI52_04485 [Bacteroidota bacterium]
MRGDGPGTVALVGAVLWFCATLAIGLVISHAAWLAETDGTVNDLAAMDWRPIWTVALAWVATLNVPLWALGWWRWRQTRAQSNQRL